MILKLIKYPDPILLTPSEYVPKITPEILKFIQDMIDTMQHVPWGSAAGLAASQVGKNLRIFITNNPVTVFINPDVEKTNSLNYCEEGCYSLVDDKIYKTWRSQSVWISYAGVDGKRIKQKFNGYKAQVIQHEFDHLEGKLCAEEIDENNRALQKLEKGKSKVKTNPRR